MPCESEGVSIPSILKSNLLHIIYPAANNTHANHMRWSWNYAQTIKLCNMLAGMANLTDLWNSKIIFHASGRPKYKMSIWLVPLFLLSCYSFISCSFSFSCFFFLFLFLFLFLVIIIVSFSISLYSHDLYLFLFLSVVLVVSPCFSLAFHHPQNFLSANLMSSPPIPFAVEICLWTSYVQHLVPVFFQF